MDGWAVLTALKKDPKLVRIPVIIMSMISEKNMGYTLGAADYITKPIDHKQLVEVIEKHRSASYAGSQHVLVVDDDPAARETLRRALHKEGWAISEAGTDARRLTSKCRPISSTRPHDARNGRV
jgi:DNA-binding response OmpR family regulator